MRNERGQTLLEIIAAIGVMVLILSAVTVAALSALSNSTASKNQNLATSYAQQGIESMRNLRTTDYATFTGLGNSATQYYCLAKTCDSLDSTQPSCWVVASGAACGANVDTFNRYVVAPFPSSDCVSSTKEIQVIVGWSDGKCSGGAFCHQVKVTSCFSNDPAAPAP